MAESIQEALEQAGVTGTETSGGTERTWGVPGLFGRGAVNVGETERWASAIGGGALALYGITRLITHGSWGGAVLALVGGSLIYRGTSGHCAMYEAAGINTAETAEGSTKSPVVSVPASRGIKVEESIVINNRTPEELYRFWRSFENLPRFMNHLESVTMTSGNRSHWVAKAPAGTSVEWDAEVYNEKEGELIAWRSLEGADVDSAGSVHFTAAPGGGGAEVRVVLKYDPPGGVIGATVAKLFGEEPSQQIREDLRRFKQLMETGNASTTGGQPSGRSAQAGQ
ncbi:MAG TPA: SRPBCC family protein [Pyrinomonadaceae bacterium]|nr:SRPBCC family protein [Pyrinomonadaceae bacterium]